MKDKFTNLKESLEKADMVLIGIGGEFKISEKNGKEAYQNLLALIKDKNYFIVTTNQEGGLAEFGFSENKVVEPCGTYYKMQCPNGCGKAVYEITDDRRGKIKERLWGGVKPEETDFITEVCPECGEKLVFNLCTQKNYVEEGYLEQWSLYMKWLQGTLHKKVCILELGVGMKYPTVIRWPFEKAAYLNQKAMFFRVHSKLYQLTEELQDKGVSVKATPMEFLGNQIV